MQETVISNERLHAALTAPALRLVTALALQITGSSDFIGEPTDARAARRQPPAQRHSSSGSRGGRASGQEDVERADSVGSVSRVNICVMEGVQEDAYRGCELMII